MPSHQRELTPVPPDGILICEALSSQHTELCLAGKTMAEEEPKSKL